MESIGQAFVRGVVWMSGSRLIIRILTFSFNIVLIRILNPEDFGTYALAISITSLFFILGSWSFPSAIIQAKEMDQDFFDTACILSLGVGIALAAVTFGSSYILRYYYSTHVITIILIVSILRIPLLISRCYGAALQRGMEFRGLAILQVATELFPSILAVGMAFWGFGVWSLVWKQGAFVVATSLGLLVISPWKCNWNFSLTAARRLLRFGSKMFLTRGIESFSQSFRDFLIGTFVGTQALGYFDRAVKFSEIGHSVASEINQVSLVAYSQLQSFEERRSKAFKMVSFFLIRIFAIVAVLFMLLGEEMVVFIYGAKWQISGRLVQLLPFYILLFTLFGNLKMFLISQARMLDIVVAKSAEAIILFTGLWLFLPGYGIFGAAWTMNISILVAFSILFGFTKNYVNVDFKRFMYPAVLAAAMSGAPIIILTNVLGFGGSPSGLFLLTTGAFILLLYTLTLWLTERRVLMGYFSDLSKYIGLRIP